MGGYDLLPPAKNPLKPKRPPVIKIAAFVCVASLFSIFAYHSMMEEPITTSTSESLPEDSFDADGGDHPESVRRMAADGDGSAAATGAAAAAAAAKADAEEAAAAASDGVVDVNIKVGEEEMKLHLKLLPEFSASSVAFLKEAAAASCPGELYRSEHHFLIQGRISCGHHGKTTTRVVKGDCPPGTAQDPHRKCPEHDPNCGCHGPIMKRGMVGWAGGGAGPDFFVYIGDQPAAHWAHDHTVFASVHDADSWETIRAIGELPVRHGGMTLLVSPLRVALE